MCQVICDDASTKMAAASFYIEFKFDVVLRRIFVYLHAPASFQVGTTIIDYSVVFLELFEGSLKHRMRKCFLPFIIIPASHWRNKEQGSACFQSGSVG